MKLCTATTVTWPARLGFSHWILNINHSHVPPAAAVPTADCFQITVLLWFSNPALWLLVPASWWHWGSLQGWCDVLSVGWCRSLAASGSVRPSSSLAQTETAFLSSGSWWCKHAPTGGKAVEDISVNQPASFTCVPSFWKRRSWGRIAGIPFLVVAILWTIYYKKMSAFFLWSVWDYIWSRRISNKSAAWISSEKSLKMNVRRFGTCELTQHKSD